LAAGVERQPFVGDGRPRTVAQQVFEMATHMQVLRADPARGTPCCNTAGAERYRRSFKWKSTGAAEPCAPRSSWLPQSALDKPAGLPTEIGT
jgi:hypothetical protein